MILVDTSVWIDFLRGANSRERQTLHRLIEDEEDISLTQIIFTEILQGIKREKEFETVKEHLLDFPIMEPKGIETYILSAQIYRDCRKKGKTVRATIDCVIAAICIEHGLTLLHKDRDFNLIEACTSLECYKAQGK